MRKTKISELFPYENIVNEKTLKAKVLVWNNKTMLIAEENSVLFAEKPLCFDEIIEGIQKSDEAAITILLYAAIANANENYSIEEFIDYFNENELAEYTKAVTDGLMNYLPDVEMQQEINEINEIFNKESSEFDEESDHWAFYFYFCKKYVSMTDEEFLNSTWRTISILQREYLKNHPKYKQEKVVPAECVDI